MVLTDREVAIRTKEARNALLAMHRINKEQWLGLYVTTVLTCINELMASPDNRDRIVAVLTAMLAEHRLQIVPMN